MIAEAIVFGWPHCVTALGLAGMVCYVAVSFMKHVFGPGRDGPTEDRGLPEDPTPNYRSETTTTTTEIDHDAIKEVLKEMGYPECTADGKDALVSALNRDYSALLKRVDEISSNSPLRPRPEVGLTETDKE